MKTKTIILPHYWFLLFMFWTAQITESVRYAGIGKYGWAVFHTIACSIVSYIIIKTTRDSSNG